jgi:hypothetical protein
VISPRSWSAFRAIFRNMSAVLSSRAARCIRRS